MKNLIKTVALTCFVVFLFSCEKESSNNPEVPTSQIDESTIIDKNLYSGLTVQNSVLCFETVAYYESIVSDESENFGVDELTEYLNKTSFNSYGKKYAENSTFDEEFMDAIMNEDQIIKIGEWFIFIDIPSETVLALSDSEENAYQGLVNKTNRNIKIFSVGDDVLYHLETNTNPEDRACGGVGGGTYPSPNLWIGSWATSVYVDFFRAGIYYRLKAGADPTSSGVYNQTIEVVGPEAWRKRKPCNSGTIGTSAAGNKASGSGNFVWAFYTGTRNLNGYYLFARISVQTTSGTVFTSSAGRNINSPY
jgi:hypothetical protein